MITTFYNDFKPDLQHEDQLFAETMAIKGKVFRSAKGRETSRFINNGKAYFIKKHFGVGWCEIIKNLLQFKLPITSAKNEFNALTKLKELGILAPTIVGYGERGTNPAKKQSFIITEEITNIEGLRDVALKWQEKKPDFYFKKNLIEEIAKIARVMHKNGINHRDFYLDHFLLDKSFYSAPNSNSRFLRPNVFLFDPHRAQLREKVPVRWIIKDLGSLYFSSMNANLTQRDLIRFLKVYFDNPGREIIKTHKVLLRKIDMRAQVLYQKLKIKNKSEQYIQQKSFNHFFVCDKDYFSENMRAFLNTPGIFIEQGKMLKEGDTSTVVKIVLDNRPLVIKRYNIINFWHRLKRLITPSRATRSWQNACMLLHYNILTSKPIAYLEKRVGPFKSTAYFVTEFIDGELASDYFAKEKNKDNLQFYAKKLVAILLKLKKLHIKHRDMKATNFIISDDEIYMIDLDGMRKYSPLKYKLTKSFQKSKKRLMKNWKDNADIEKIFLELLENKI